jgi:hypothetical protein
MWLLFLLTTIAVYLLLPFDWMPHHRFGTPFFVMFLLLTDSVVEREKEAKSAEKSIKKDSRICLDANVAQTTNWNEKRRGRLLCH